MDTAFWGRAVGGSLVSSFEIDGSFGDTRTLGETGARTLGLFLKITTSHMSHHCHIQTPATVQKSIHPSQSTVHHE